MTLLEAVLGIITVAATIFVAVITYRHFRSSRPQIDQFTRLLTIYRSREDLLEAMRQQYYGGTADTEVWGQCVNCGNYGEGLYRAVLEGVSRGLSYKIIVNSNSSSARDVASLFGRLPSAIVRFRGDNAFSMQGLGDREVIVAVSDTNSYVGFRVRHEGFVRSLRGEFRARWGEAQEEPPKPADAPPAQ